MHGFTASLEKRLRALERRLGAVPTPETAAESARRLVLVRAAHSGELPEDLTPEERPVFSRIVATLPIARQLAYEGIVGDDGGPAGGDDHPHHQDDTETGEPVWSP